jgi:pimeloyl-ACP methyl ester carboxylesterase
MSNATVIIGGYNSAWPAYLRMARHLEDLTGVPTVGVPLMPWDWWLSTRQGDATRILHKLSGTLSWARRRLGADRFVLVGHSAGGLVARLYPSNRPVWGKTYHGAGNVAGIVTLGTPHCSTRLLGNPEKEGESWYLVDEANRTVPGAAYSDQIHYLTVAGRYLYGRTKGSRRERRAHQVYEFFGAQGGDAWGDGVVPVACAQLDGAETVVLEGVAHSARYGRNWYGGFKEIIRSWCPSWISHGS